MSTPPPAAPLPPPEQSLNQRFPTTTLAECRRFHAEFGADSVVERLEHYVQWRQEHFGKSAAGWVPVSGGRNDEETNESDDPDWNAAVQAALTRQSTMIANRPAAEIAKHSVSDGAAPSRNQRRYRRRLRRRAERPHQSRETYPFPPLIVAPLQSNNQAWRDHSGHRIFYHLPAQILLQLQSPVLNDSSASSSFSSTEFYTNVFAYYFDRQFDRESDEKVTLLIDVRPGIGWPNPPALEMVNFIRPVARTLYDLFPQRLHRCILFPVPHAAVLLWKLIRGFLEAHLTERMVLLSGRATVQSPIPDQLKEYVSEDGIQQLEAMRQAAFLITNDDDDNDDHKNDDTDQQT